MGLSPAFLEVLRYSSVNPDSFFGSEIRILEFVVFWFGLGFFFAGNVSWIFKACKTKCKSCTFRNDEVNLEARAGQRDYAP